MGIQLDGSTMYNGRGIANAERQISYNVNTKSQNLLDLLCSTGKRHACQIFPIEDLQERIELARWLRTQLAENARTKENMQLNSLWRQAAADASHWDQIRAASQVPLLEPP